MAQYLLAEKEKMMSSSDGKRKKHIESSWQPLVPGQLEKCEADVDDIEARKNPEMDRSFKALYEQHLLEKKKFSLLYVNTEEDFSDDEEEGMTEEKENKVEGEFTEGEYPVVEEPELPDIESIERTAYEAGFAKGEAEGYESGLQTAKEKTERLSMILCELDAFWANLIKTGEKRIIDLVARVAEKVVYGQVSVDNEIITRAILDVFEKIPDPVDATITVNPVDYEYIEVVKDDLFEKIRGLKQVRILSDQLITPGGCRIETKAGEVDTTMEERLEAVKKSILSVTENF